MIYRLVCTGCRASARADVADHKIPAHVSPLALALRRAAKVGWLYRGGRIGKSVIDVLCPRCHPVPLHLEGDVDPRDATAKSYEFDLTDDPEEPTVVVEDTP